MNLQMSNYTGYEQFNFIRNVSTYERDPRNIQMDGKHLWWGVAISLMC